ncbi:MAG: hypothetical protein ABII90_15545 [Bacteroidota bacterium]
MKTIILSLILVFTCSLSIAQHNVILRSGEKLTGVVIEIKDDVLSLAVNMEIKKIDMKNVSSIFFNEYVAYDGSLQLDEEIKTIQSGDYLIKYQMKDRTIVKPPIISIGTLDKGTVAVEVTINRSGLVMRAVPGISGSTTSNNYLLTKAKVAAQSAMFDKNSLAPIEQKGTIIITY